MDIAKIIAVGAVLYVLSATGNCPGCPGKVATPSPIEIPEGGFYGLRKKPRWTTSKPTLGY